MIYMCCYTDTASLNTDELFQRGSGLNTYISYYFIFLVCFSVTNVQHVELIKPHKTPNLIPGSQETKWDKMPDWIDPFFQRPNSFLR